MASCKAPALSQSARKLARLWRLKPKRRHLGDYIVQRRQPEKQPKQRENPVVDRFENRKSRPRERVVGGPAVFLERHLLGEVSRRGVAVTPDECHLPQPQVNAEPRGQNNRCADYRG
jgi:hypothetical protein